MAIAYIVWGVYWIPLTNNSAIFLTNEISNYIKNINPYTHR